MGQETVRVGVPIKKESPSSLSAERNERSTKTLKELPPDSFGGNLKKESPPYPSHNNNEYHCNDERKYITQPATTNLYGNNNDHLCMICKDNFVNIRFDPCGHSVVCESCALRLLICPICRKGIELFHHESFISRKPEQHKHFDQYPTFQEQQQQQRLPPQLNNVIHHHQQCNNNQSIIDSTNTISSNNSRELMANTIPNRNSPLSSSQFTNLPFHQYNQTGSIQQHRIGMSTMPTSSPQKLGLTGVQCNSNGLSKYYNESQRFKTFFTWPRDAEVQPVALVKAGFFYTEKNDIVQCCMCGLVVCDWRQSDDPIQIHMSRRSNCPFLLKNPHITQKLGGGNGGGSTHLVNSNNNAPFIIQQQDYLAYGNQPTVKNLHVVGTDVARGVGLGMRPRHHVAPPPAPYQTRPLQNYQQQQNFGQLPSYVNRFQSNMQPLYPSSSPPHRHLIKTTDTNVHSPPSSYQQQHHQKDQESSIGRTNHNTTTEEYSPPPPSSSLQNKMKTHCSSLTARDDGKSCGDSNSIDDSSITNQLNTAYPDSAAEILKIHNRNQERARMAYEQEIQQNGGRRNSSKNNMNSFCKICEDNPVKVTFVPCGHLVVCESCALGLLMCPMCRKGIDKTIRTFFYGN